MIKKLLVRADLCWKTSLTISCSIFFLEHLILFLGSFITDSVVVAWTAITFSLIMQLISIALAGHASISSNNSKQHIVSVIITIIANIIMIALLFWGMFLISFLTYPRTLS